MAVFDTDRERVLTLDEYVKQRQAQGAEPDAISEEVETRSTAGKCEPLFIIDPSHNVRDS